MDEFLSQEKSNRRRKIKYYKVSMGDQRCEVSKERSKNKR